jgi:two-component sensor histidine kinase/CHASE3 domain sensor protein
VTMPRRAAGRDPAGSMQELQSPRPSLPLTLMTTLSFVLLLVAAALLYRVSEQSREAEDWVVHTLEVKHAIAELLSDLSSAESGQRGYLLTDDPVFLEPYWALRASLDDELQQLRSTVSDNPEQLDRFAALAPVIVSRLDAIEQTLLHASRGEAAQAKDVVRRQGLPLMIEVRARLEEMDAVEGRLLIERQGRLADVQRRFIVRRYVLVIHESRERLAKYNAELEARVRDRTDELAGVAETANRERARAEALLTDVNHRVGNNLALVSSFLTMQQRAVKNPDAQRALSAAKARVQAIASAHRKLRLGADFATVNASEVLGAVLEDIRAGLPPGDLIRIEPRVESLEINARDAVSLGVLTSELVMNAIKHAFLPGDSGEVQVVLANHGGSSPYLEVSDDGVGWHEKHTHEPGGLGGKIIEMVARQFGGRPERTPRQHDDKRPGTRVRVDLVKLQFVRPT